MGEPGQAIIPEGGAVMLYGDGGASKTTLSIDLAFHLATGEDWLGITVPRRVRVLLIEAEGLRPLFREKLRRKLAFWESGGHGDPGEGLQILQRPWADFRFDDATGIANEIGQRRIDVLIVGPLTRVGMDELGTLQQVRDFMAEVDRFRELSGRRLTVFLVHHENKGGTVSGAWEGAGDTLLHAQVRARGHTSLTFQKTRWAPSRHKETLEVAWTDGESFEIVSKEERELAAEAEELLSGTEEWLTAEEIGRSREKGGIGANKESVREALDAHSGRFTSRTGKEAQAVGRSPRATVWQLARISERVERVGSRDPDSGSSSLTRSPLRGESEVERVSSVRAGVARPSERVGADCPSYPESAPTQPDPSQADENTGGSP